MKVAADMVVSLRFIMKNDKGEVIEDIMNQKPVEYLHGAGNILPSLETGIEGLQAGDKKLISFTNPSLSENYELDVIIENIRPATPDELKSGKPEVIQNDEICGPDCCC